MAARPIPARSSVLSTGKHFLRAIACNDSRDKHLTVLASWTLTVLTLYNKVGGFLLIKGPDYHFKLHIFSQELDTLTDKFHRRNFLPIYGLLDLYLDTKLIILITMKKELSK